MDSPIHLDLYDYHNPLADMISWLMAYEKSTRRIWFFNYHHKYISNKEKSTSSLQNNSYARSNIGELILYSKELLQLSPKHGILQLSFESC